jgi:alkaline phosphatase
VVGLLFAGAVLAAVYGYLTAEGELPIGSNVLRLQPVTERPLATAGPPKPVTIPSAEGTVRNVILFIGDGMGVGQVSSASILLYGPHGGLSFEQAPVIGLMRTYSGSDLVTDSAASATALATGHTTTNRMLSMLPDGTEPATVLEAAQARGLATGVVTTSGLIDATPAGFATHSASRYDYGTVLSGMLQSGVDVMLGGDWRLLDEARRGATPEQARQLIESARASGYHVVRTAEELAAASGPRVIGLFPQRPGGNADANGPDLEQSTRAALRSLAQDPDGFVAMIECEITDGAGHANSIDLVVDGVAELDRAVRVALEFAAEHGDTLVIVTADHDTGGLGIDHGDRPDGPASIRWATISHTAQWVPVFAYGPGSSAFDGLIHTTDMAVVLDELLDLPAFPSGA